MESIIHITIGSNKMAGINSINTSTINNIFCQKMSQTDSICKKCYASRYEKMRPANLVNIVKKNPHCNFALWSKRKNLINDFFASNEKPSNLILIYSSPVIDKVSRLPKHFNKVFTAHNKKTLTPINCHGGCADCLLCYKHNDTVFINEKIK